MQSKEIFTAIKAPNSIPIAIGTKFQIPNSKSEIILNTQYRQKAEIVIIVDGVRINIVFYPDNALLVCKVLEGETNFPGIFKVLPFIIYAEIKIINRGCYQRIILVFILYTSNGLLFLELVESRLMPW